MTRLCFVLLVLLAFLSLGCDRRGGTERLRAEGFVVYSWDWTEGWASVRGGVALSQGVITPLDLYGWIENVGSRTRKGWVEFSALLYDTKGKVVAEQAFVVRIPDSGWTTGKTLFFSVTFHGVDLSRIVNHRIVYIREQRQ